MAIPQWFVDGGVFMHFVLLTFFVSLGIVIVAGANCSASSKGTFLKIALAFVFLPAVVGAFGYYISYLQVMSAVAMVDPAIKQEIYDMSMKVARLPLIFGGSASLFLLLIWGGGYKICKKYSSK